MVTLIIYFKTCTGTANILVIWGLSINYCPVEPILIIPLPKNRNLSMLVKTITRQMNSFIMVKL